ncbi:MAG: DSD1 family PLP-dependent enzyme [Dehalococcoidia bacterium]
MDEEWIGLSVEELDTPALVVDIDKMERNIAAIMATLRENGVAWRPHVKCHKSPDIARRLVAAGAVGITCAKLSEAEVMADAGLEHMLIANEIVGPRKVARLMALRRRVEVMVAVDDPAQVAELSAAARAQGLALPVLVEVDIGQNRCGVEPGEAAVALSRTVHDAEGLDYRGLMGWEGHVMFFEEAERIARESESAVGKLVRSAEMCRQAGLPVEMVSAGGTVSYRTVGRLPGITEIQAGGGVLMDAFYEKRGVPLEPSLIMLTTVISRKPQRAIVDGGFKTFGSPLTPPRPLATGVTHFEFMSAEHGTLHLASPDVPLKVGDKVSFVAGYVDAVAFLHERLFAARDGRVVEVWPIAARGKLQ